MTTETEAHLRELLNEMPAANEYGFIVDGRTLPVTRKCINGCIAALPALLDELDRLRAQVADLHDACRQKQEILDSDKQVIAGLMAENERLTSCIDAIEALHRAALTGTLEK